MSPQQIIIVIAAIIVFVLAASQVRRGPRVTQITRTVKRDEPGEDE